VQHILAFLCLEFRERKEEEEENQNLLNLEFVRGKGSGIASGMDKTQAKKSQSSSCQKNRLKVSKYFLQCASLCRRRKKPENTRKGDKRSERNT
jgi:hypothetical protein